jgi:hypothetical protein
MARLGGAGREIKPHHKEFPDPSGRDGGRISTGMLPRAHPQRPEVAFRPLEPLAPDAVSRLAVAALHG